MAVYIDAPKRHRFRGRLIWSSHLMADSSEELVAFARALGMKPAWLQNAGAPKEHFDVFGRARHAAAVRAGAHQVSSRDLVRLIQRRRAARQ